MIRFLLVRTFDGFFFFKQKTAYEMSISDWSSDVCSSDLLANWDMRVPKKGPLVGGAMDLAVGAKAVWIIMEHNTRSGGSRLLTRCTLPLTAVACVKRVYTDIAVVDVTPQGFVVREMLEGLSAEELQRSEEQKSEPQ